MLSELNLRARLSAGSAAGVHFRLADLKHVLTKPPSSSLIGNGKLKTAVYSHLYIKLHNQVISRQSIWTLLQLFSGLPVSL